VTDFAELLRQEKCWDRETEAIFHARGEPLEDCVLQNRDELLGLCEFIERAGVRSYLEIGIWTGRLVSALHRIFDFDLVAACDHGWAARCGFEIHVPAGARRFEGDSASEGYHRWRAALGHVDLTLIDADHRYHAVRRDFEINRAFPHRFLAFHDICGARRETAGVRRLWLELDGEKTEIVRPHVELGLDRSLMGIGIWRGA
jgi:hypothetical protein